MHQPFPYRYCPWCRAELTRRVVFDRLRPACSQCGFVHLRDPKVSVVARVSRGRRVLLVRRRHRPARGAWALPGGYMEADEMPQDALRREMAEETGLSIQAIRFVDFFPLFGLDAHPEGIVIAFQAAPAAVGSASAGEIEARDDASEVRWFDAGRLPRGLAFASTRELLRRWRRELNAYEEMP